jgi:hypothetical protein
MAPSPSRTSGGQPAEEFGPDGGRDGSRGVRLALVDEARRAFDFLRMIEKWTSGFRFLSGIRIAIARKLRKARLSAEFGDLTSDTNTAAGYQQKYQQFFP